MSEKSVECLAILVREEPKSSCSGGPARTVTRCILVACPDGGRSAKVARDVNL